MKLKAAEKLSLVLKFRTLAAVITDRPGVCNIFNFISGVKKNSNGFRNTVKSFRFESGALF